MRGVCGLVVLFLIGAPAATTAGPVGDAGEAPPVEGVITNPDWQARPTAEAVASQYPQAARALGVAGTAELDCAVQVSGDLSECRVVHERPTGFGFGVAALALSTSFKMRPKMVDGTPVVGGRVDIPIRFSMAANEALIPFVHSPAPLYPEPVPAALALAGKLAALSGSPDNLPPEVQGAVRSMEQFAHAEGIDPAQAAAVAAASEAFTQSLQGSADAFAAARAQALAQTFSPDELTAIVAFFSSPAGKAWATRMDDVNTLEATRMADILRQAVGAARRAACSRVSADKEAAGCSP